MFVSAQRTIQLEYTQGIMLNRSVDFYENLFEYFPQGLIAIDFETTGLSPLTDEIIEIGAVKLNPKNEKLELFQTLIRPVKSIPQVVIDIHGITDESVKDAPSLKEVLPQFLSFIDGNILVAHNAQFDAGFFLHSLQTVNMKAPNSEVFCTLKMSKKILKNQRSFNLASLAEKFNINLTNHHRALDDAFACLDVLSGILHELTKSNMSMEKINKIMDESKIFNILEFTKNVDFEVPNNLALLTEAINENLEVEIRYRGGSVRDGFRPIRPLGILPQVNGSILFAHCLISKQNKNFILKKVMEVRKKLK